MCKGDCRRGEVCHQHKNNRKSRVTKLYICQNIQSCSIASSLLSRYPDYSNIKLLMLWSLTALG